MAPARNEMRAVHLVEEDEVDVDPASGRADLADPADPDSHADPAGPADPDHRLAPRTRWPAAARRRSGRRRLPRRWTVAAALVAVLALGGATVVQERRESDRLAEVALLPGVLDPLDAPLTEVWRSEHRLWSPLTRVGPLVVGVSDTWDGSRDIVVVGLDAATGEERWATTLVRSSRSPIGGVRCVVPDAAPGAAEQDRVVVCLSIDALGPSPQDMSELEPREARLLVLSSGTGEVLEERAVDASTSVAALGPDLVVKDVTDDGRVRVARTGPRGRDERWAFTGPPADPAPRFAFVRTDEDLVLVPGESGWVLTADGDVVHAWQPDRPAAAGWADVIRGRALVQPLRDVLGETRLVDLRSGQGFTVDGFPLTATVDDGSTGDLVLVQSSRGEGLLAQDIGSGRTRWSLPGADEGGILVLDGVVVRADADELRAVDARTGETLWSTPATRGRQFGLYTDGRLLVRTERDLDLGTVLVARGLDDGRVRWTSDIADDIEHLVELEGRLLGVTEDGTVAFGDTAVVVGPGDGRGA